MRRERQHVHPALAEGGFGQVLFVGQIPVLDHAGTAEHLLSGRHVRDARCLRHGREHLGRKNHEAMRADEDALAGGRLRLRGEKAPTEGEEKEEGEETGCFHSVSVFTADFTDGTDTKIPSLQACHSWRYEVLQQSAWGRPQGLIQRPRKELDSPSRHPAADFGAPAVSCRSHHSLHLAGRFGLGGGRALLEKSLEPIKPCNKDRK